MVSDPARKADSPVEVMKVKVIQFVPLKNLYIRADT